VGVACLGETGSIFTGNSIDAGTRERLERNKHGRPFVATKDVGYGFDPIGYDNGLLVPVSDKSFNIARAHSVLICAEGGSAGRKIGITDRDICFGNKLLANETWSVVSARFVMFVYLSTYFYEQFVEQKTGVIGGISINKFLQLPFPLPPLNEQRRIVAKVDELIALCDRLEMARVNREAVRDRLMAASLARLNAPDPETFAADARFALDAFPALTARPDLIRHLRQTIFNLAVRGSSCRRTRATNRRRSC
jgi:type I restriction enzyme S subunit